MRDVVPSSVQYGTIGSLPFPTRWSYSSRQITGVNESITLRAEYDDSLALLKYKINAGISNGVDYTLTGKDASPTSNGFNLWLPGGLIGLYNNDYFDLVAEPLDASTSDWAFIYNDSLGPANVGSTILFCPAISFTDGSA